MNIFYIYNFISILTVQTQRYWNGMQEKCCWIEPISNWPAVLPHQFHFGMRSGSMRKLCQKSCRTKEKHEHCVILTASTRNWTGLDHALCTAFGTIKKLFLSISSELTYMWNALTILLHYILYFIWFVMIVLYVYKPLIFRSIVYQKYNIIAPLVRLVITNYREKWRHSCCCWCHHCRSPLLLVLVLLQLWRLPLLLFLLQTLVNAMASWFNECFRCHSTNNDCI